MMRSVLHLVIALVFATPSLASADARGSFERTLEISGPLQLEVSTVSGSITVRTGANDTLEIKGEVRARDSWAEDVRRIVANPPIGQDGSVVKIGPLDDQELRRHVSVSYELVVPVDTDLVSSTGSGSQKIADIAGPVDATSGSGSLDIGRIGADVQARTGSGSIDIDGVAGELDVTSGSGSIRAGDVAGAISATSGSGSVRLEQTGSGDVVIDVGSGRVRVAGVRGGLRVNSGSGSVDARGEMTGDWDLHASSGSITVSLPDDSGFDVDAETRSGRVQTSHPITVSTRNSKKSLRGSVGGGGPRLTVRTSSGSIRIR